MDRGLAPKDAESMGREDKLKLSLLGATARGYLQKGDDVAGLEKWKTDQALKTAWR